MDSKSVDMLHGPLLGKILRYAIPFALSSILEQLFITIDVAVVGRFASSEALAAVVRAMPSISRMGAATSRSTMASV